MTQGKRPERPKVNEVVYLVDGYYMMEGNECGGPLHIALDDGNMDDGHVDFCIEEAAKANDRCGVALGHVLRLMTKTQRRKVYNLAHGTCVDPAGMARAPFIFDCYTLLARSGVDVNRLTPEEASRDGSEAR